MAIPKLLEQMRHSVQDTGDTMVGDYSILEAGSLLIENKQGAPQIKLTGNQETDSGLTLQAEYNGSDYSYLYFHSDDSNDGGVILQGITDPENPNEAATKNYVDTALENAGGTFYAQYGTTTYAEVVAAYNAGKTIKAYGVGNGIVGHICDLETVPSGSNTLYFIARPYNSYANTYDLTLSLTSASVWSVVNSLQRKVSVSNPLQYNGSTTISTNPYYRPIRVSTAAPTSSDGNVGDIWIQYFS